MLFILDIANNHFGDVEHAKTLISELKAATEDLDTNIAIKFQFRDLDTLINQNFADKIEEFPYIGRFISTRLDKDQFEDLSNFALDAGFIVIATPFDENSVDQLCELNYTTAKVASCSMTDWPLLEKIAKSSVEEVIVSTGGSSYEDIHKVVAFFAFRQKAVALMHCVSEYPTETKSLNLGQISYIKNALYEDGWKDIPIGWSTHESPGDTTAVKLAYAAGARIFEKHVGLRKPHGINAYSATPKQVRAWIKSALKAKDYIGDTEMRYKPSEKEISTLRSLRRGVYAVRDMEPSSKVSGVMLAIPAVEGQLTANDLSKYNNIHVSDNTIKMGTAVMSADVSSENTRDAVTRYVSYCKNLASTHGISIPDGSEFELSHHYGIKNFDKVGCAIATVVNRDYCKKIIFVLPGQMHPEQFHNEKEETFHLIQGDLQLIINGEWIDLGLSETRIVHPGDSHSFSSVKGAIIEEISTNHKKDDSFYKDKSIHDNDRKTTVTNWKNN